MKASRVLVVEDETDVANLVKLTLERTGGLDVATVPSGTEAIEAVFKAPPAPRSKPSSVSAIGSSSSVSPRRRHE